MQEDSKAMTEISSATFLTKLLPFLVKHAYNDTNLWGNNNNNNAVLIRRSSLAGL